MKSYRENYLLCFVIIALFFHFVTAQTQTIVSEASFIYDGTEFGLFEASPNINQPNAQTQCMTWGGNLATIESAVEDSLLLYSSPDLDTIFTCHIGLDKTGGTEFVWIDSSSSSYRNWGMDFPSGVANLNCVRYRYKAAGDVLSQGWLNDPCTVARNCYFCSKPGMSNGCDLIYNGSCYKVFEVSTPIKWLDAQSSCAIWGGDLTSITTERENNYLITLITSSVGNCWIGLNDRNTEGTYTWIDGTAVSYTNWTSTPPNVANSDCVRINNAGNGMWEFVSCDDTLNAILCKRDSSITIPTGARFGRITNGGLEFEALTGNTFFYEPLKLVCGSDGSSVEWRYSQNSDISGASLLQETSNHVGFSWLDVDNTIQGYYWCLISNAISHIVGVYDKTLTTVAVTGTSYTYIVGVDRTDVLLLCDPEDGGSLSMLRWSPQNGMGLLNPINLNSEISNLPDVSTSFSCVKGGDTLNYIQICVKVPTISISYGVVPVTSYSSVYPAVNALSVPSAVQDITLSINIEGKWKLPDNTESTNSLLTILNFSSDNNGVYKFYTNNWDNVEVCAIQIILAGVSNGCDLTNNSSCYKVFEVGTPINWLDAQSSCAIWGGDLTSITTERENNYLNTLITSSVGNCWIGLNDRGVEGTYTWIDGRSVSYTNWTSAPPNVANSDCVQINNAGNGYWYSVNCEETSNTFVCKRPNIPITVQFGQLVNGGLDFQVLQNGTILGGSLTLACRGDGTSETQWIYSQNLDLSNSQEISATFNIETGLSWLKIEDSKQGVYMCQIYDTTSYMVVLYRHITFVGDTMISDTPLPLNYTVGSFQILYYPNDNTKENIKWTPNDVKDGDTEPYSKEFPNPVEMSTVFSEVGTGVHIMTAFYRMSPVTLIRSVELAIKDIATITVNYNGTIASFSDVNNPIFPSAQELDLPVGITNITFTCDLSVCIWKISNEANAITVDTYIISEISYSQNINISLIRMTSIGIEYTTAHIYIHIGAFPTQSSSNSLQVVTIVIILIIFIIVILIIVILIPISIFLCRKKQKSTNTAKRPKHSIPSKEGYPDYQNLSQVPSKEYIELQADPNPQYMTIDESSMVPLESDYQYKRDYQNLANAPTYTGPYEEIPVADKKASKPYEKYVTMSSVKEEKKFVPRNIPIKQFPATYQQYAAASGIDKDSLFSVEFVSLEEGPKINVEPTNNEAVSNINDPTNPVKSIVSFDENRLVLDSEYSNCNYINASYIYESQFIATIHPNKATHRDFLQMIYQTEASMVIMLTTRSEKAKIIGGVSNRVCYWPKKDESIDCEPFVTTLINSIETTAFVKQEISLKNTLEGKEHTFTQCISPIWNEDSTVAEIPSAVALLNRILKQLQDDASKSIIIHCEDGISKTGIILAGIISVKELTLKKTINIFNTIKNLRKQRMRMVPTLACYTTCYSLMNEYCSIHL